MKPMKSISFGGRKPPCHLCAGSNDCSVPPIEIVQVSLNFKSSLVGFKRWDQDIKCQQMLTIPPGPWCRQTIPQAQESPTQFKNAHRAQEMVHPSKWFAVDFAFTIVREIRRTKHERS